MNMGIGRGFKRFSVRSLALLVSLVMIVQLVWTGDVALGASPFAFRGYDVENITASMLSTTDADVIGNQIIIDSAVAEGEAVGFIALDDPSCNISDSIRLGGIEIDFSTTTIVTEEGAGGAENDVPTVSIAFCGTNFSNVISTVDLAKQDSTATSEVLSCNDSIPTDTRSIIIYLRGESTSGANTVIFQDTSFIIHDASAPACSVDYNHNWTKNPVTVTITASDSDSGLKGIYVDGAQVSTTSPYTFTASANTSFSAYSMDYAGKTSATQNVTISNIDTGVPSAPASLTLSHDTWTNENVTVTMPALGTSSGSPERYRYQLNGGAWADMPAGFTVTNSGQFNINVAVADAAGNVSPSIGDTIYIDKLAPSIDRVTTAISSGSVDVTVETSEAGLSGISALKYEVGSHDAAYFTAGGGTDIVDGSFTVSAGGVFTIYVADNAGNCDIGEYVLNTAPTLTHTENFEMDEDEPANVVLEVGDGESSLSELIVAAEASDPAIISNVHINKSNEQISIDLTPAANVSGGPVTITVTVKDKQGEQVTDTFQVTVRAVNDAPVAVDDLDIKTKEDTGVKINVLGNDTDTADGDTLTVSDSGTPEHGTTGIVGGQILYMPFANYNGDDQFTYTLSDGHGGIASATVYITVAAVNDAPVAVADAITVAEDGSILIPVLLNDTDVDADDVVSLFSAQNGTHGTAVPEGNMVRYTPAPDYFSKDASARDTFTYVIHDSGGLESTGTVTVTVTGAEDAPYFEGLNSEYTINEDSLGAEITFLIKDVETPADTLMLQAAVTDETLLKNSGIEIVGLGDSSDSVKLRFTPVANAYGDVTVSLALGDGFATVIESFELHITNVNDAPTAKADEITYPEHSASVTIETSTLIANDTDIDGDDTLSFAGIDTTVGNGTLTQVDADTYQYTPDTDSDGTDSFRYIVSDSHGEKAVGTCTLKAIAVNDAPVITIPAGPYSTDEDTPSGEITFTISDEETDAANLIVSAASSDTDKITAGGITVVNNDGTCTLTVNPVADANGDATVTVTVSDGSLASSDHFTFTINPKPDAPVAVDDKVYVSVSGRQTFAVLNNDRDVDGDALQVIVDSWSGASLNGILSFNTETQKFTYRAANGEVGFSTFTYRVTDGIYTSEPATVRLDVNSVTHAPDISTIAYQRLGEDMQTGEIPFTAVDEDLFDTVTISVTSSNTTLLPEKPENIIVTNKGGGSYTLQLIPATDKNGSVWVTVTATDSTGKTDSALLLLTVYPDNDKPVAVDDTVTIDEDATAALTLTTNDSDPEGDTLWVNAISWPAHGWLYRSGSGYIYVPYGNWNGTETLSYSVTDGQAYDTGVVTINVTPKNDAPVNYSNWVELPNETGEESVTVNALEGDYDPDGDAVRLYEIVTQPAHGTATMNAATGEITYTRTSVSPEGNGADEIRYRIIDRETAEGDYSYADASIYIGVNFESSLYAYAQDVFCYEDDEAFTFDLSITNPHDTEYELTLDETTTLGTLEAVDNNTVRFTPGKDQNGYDEIQYTISPVGGGESHTGYIHLRVYPVNDEPVIDSAPDNVACDEDSAGTDFTVTFHDPDCDAGSLYFYAYARNARTDSPVVLTVDITVNRNGGTVQLTARPVANANGLVDIVLGVSDGITQAEHTVHMTVNAIDDAPVLAPVSRTLYEDTEITFEVLGPYSDVDGDGLTVSIAEDDGPANGSAVVNANGTVTYTPNADYNGDDNLTFTVTDNTTTPLSSTQTATLSVMPVNDQPVISNLGYYQSTKEDTPKDVTLTVTDVDNDLSGAASYTITSSNQTLIPNGNISISHVDGDDMKIHLAPAADASGSAIISIVADDGDLTAEAAFKLTVEPVNDAPEAADDTASVNENVGSTAGTTSATINLTGNDTDVEPGTLRVIAIKNVSRGTVVNNGNGTVTYSVDGDYNGTATFDYTVMDAGGASDTASVTVTVNPMNDPPRAGNDARTIVEDNEITIAVLTNDSDVEGDTLTVSMSAEDAPVNGTATVVGNSINYTPNENYVGTDSFWYDVSDGHGGTATAKVTITITPVNDMPAIEKYTPTTGEWTMAEDTTAAFNFIVSDPDTAASHLIITIDSKDKAVIKNTGIVLSTNAEGYKIITVTPEENQFGVVPVEFQVTDGTLPATTATWNITIAPVNDAPELNAPDVTTPEDTPVGGMLTAEDAEGNTLKFYKDTNPDKTPEHGSVTVNEDGSFTYTPESNYSGPDSFGVYVSDGQEAHSTDYGVVNVTITPKSDKPDAVNDTDDTSEDNAVTIPVLDNDTDYDLAYGDTLTVASVGTPGHGTAAIAPGGVTYTPNANWNGTDTFTYTVKDNDGETDTATVTVTVAQVNDDPIANPDAATTDEDKPKVIDVLLNDTDVDTIEADNQGTLHLRTQFSISLDGVTKTPDYGDVSIADGKIVYTPDTNWYGEDTFTYFILDGHGGRAEGTVTVTVNSVNDLPVFVSTPADMELTEDLENGSKNFEVSDIETPAADLDITVEHSTNPALVDTTDVTVTKGTDGNRTVIVNPRDNKNGTAVITLRVTDGVEGGYAECTFTVTVAAVNDNPVAGNDTAVTNENAAVTINALSNDDVDLNNPGDTLTLMSVGSVSTGSVFIVDNKIIFTPDKTRSDTENYDVSFTYTMHDAAYDTAPEGEKVTSSATVTVTVTPVNDAPVITESIEDVTGIPEDSDTGTGAIPFNVTDEEDDDDTLRVEAACSDGTLFSSITVSNPEGGTGSERTVQAIPAANKFGTAQITLTVWDSGNVLNDSVTFSVTVDPEDDVPSGCNDAYEVTEDIETQLDVLANDDPDYATNPEQLIITDIPTPAGHGTASIAPGGKSVYYKTEQDGNLPDWFTYQVHDTFSNQDYTFRVDITVIPVNDAPVVTMSGTEFSVYEGIAKNDIPFTVTDVDNDASTLTLSAESANPILVMNGLHIDPGTGTNRTIDVQPYRKWNGWTTITVSASDGALTGSASFKFIVNSVNEAPVANDDTLTAPEDVLTFLDVLDNDTDGDIETNSSTEHISVQSVGDAGPNATVTVAVDGSGINIQPRENWNGTVTFTYVVADAANATDTGSVTVAVNQVNDAPVADDDTATTDEDTEVTIDVLTGDTDIDQDEGLNVNPTAEVLGVSLTGTLDGPDHGSVSTDGTTVTYIPADNYNGTDTFEYFVTDEEAQDKGLVTVTVGQVNDDPTANPDAATTDEDMPKPIDVLLNDTDVDTIEADNQGTLHLRSQFSISLDDVTTLPASGDASIVDGKIVYTPDTNWFGGDTFTYWILDGHGGRAEGTVTVTVNSVNDLPVFVSTPADMELTEDLENGSKNFEVSDIETLAANLDITVEGSTNETLVDTTDVTVTKGTDGSRTVIVNPKDNQNGTAVITLRVKDGVEGGYAECTFTMTVTAVNDAPVGNDNSDTISEDTSYTVAWTGLTSDVDIATNADSVGVTITTQALHGNAVVSGNNIIYTPDSDWNGEDSFVYTVKDSKDATDTGSVTVAVNQVNDAPVADDDTANTSEDTEVTINVLTGDTDIDQDEGLNVNPTAEVLSVSLTGALDGPDHGSVSTDGTTVTYKPADNYNGTDTFEYFVTDGELQDKGLVTVTVGQVNDDPIANPDTATTDEDKPKTIDVLLNDTDVDTIEADNQGTLHLRTQFSISLDDVTTLPASGDASIVDGKIVYTPDTNWFGGDTFTYWILDGHGGHAEGTVTVTVNSVNDLPVFVSTPADMELTEDLANGSKNFEVSDIETLAANLDITVEGSTNETLVDTTDVTVTKGTDGNRTVIVNPKDNQNGTAVITLRVKDGVEGGYADCTFTVTVAAVNDAPVGNDTSGTINEDTSYTVVWTGFTSDVDIATNADSVGVTITTQALHGNAAVSGNNIIYTPDSDWNGEDSFVYTVKDSKDATDTGTITVTVNQVNDAPVADDDTADTSEDTEVTINVLDGDTDIDQNETLNVNPTAEVLGVSLTGTLDGPDHGSVSTDGTTVTYKPADNYNGTDTFEYFVTDGEAQDKGLVTVTVGQVNDDPIANPDAATTDEDTPVTIDVLLNDTDVDTIEADNQGTLHLRSQFSISLDGATKTPANGDISIADSKNVYTPDANWNGTDSFTYWILDGHGGRAEGTVTVTVGGDNDAPVAGNDSASGDEDHTVTLNVLDNDTDVDTGDALSFAAFLDDTASLPGDIDAAADGTVTFIPDPNYNGSFTVGYQMHDRDGLTDEAEITITINAVNDDPAAESFAASTDEDTAKDIDVSGAIGDVDIATNSDSLTVTVEAGDGPVHGDVTVAGAIITYTPDADWNGTDSFTYTVTDSTDAADTAVITVTVAAVNDAPVADDETVGTDEDTAVTVDVLAGDTDVDTDPDLNVTSQAAVTISGVNTPGHGDASIVEGKIVYTPDTDFNGEDSFTYTVGDGALTDTGTVSVTVSPVNDSPMANGDTATTNDEELITIDVLANDTDIDTNTEFNALPDSRSDFRITAAGDPLNGTAVIADGRIGYTPDDRFAGEDSFSYTMSDGHGGTATATVTVTVLSVNDPPATPVVHTPAGGERYGGESTVHVTWSGFDIDGDVLGYTLEYYDGSTWRVVQAGLGATEYDFEIPETLTSILDLQFRVKASDAEFTSDYGYSGKVEVDKDIPANIVVTMRTADGRPYTAGTWTNQSVIVTAVSVEDASRVVFSYAIEDKLFTGAANRVVTSGVHTVYIRATDEFGNVSEFGGYLARIDKQTPAVPDVSVTISGANAQLSFALKGDPGNSGNNYLVMPDGSRVNAGEGITWKTDKNGAYTFKLYDIAGNVTTFNVTVDQIDESAPVITCDSGDYNTGETTEQAITATLSFTDSESEIVAQGYALSDSAAYSGAYMTYADAIGIAEPGTYYLHAYAKNAFGLETYETFGPFIVAATAENPETGEEPGGDVTVDAGDIAEISEGAVKVRMPGGEWSDTLTLEDIEPGTYIIEVMDEDGNITTVEITITDEEIASGQWKPAEPSAIAWYIWVLAALTLLLILLLIWRNVKVTMYDEGGKAVRSIRRLKRRKDEVIVAVAGNAVRGSVWGTVTLGRTFTRRMQGKQLTIMQDETQVLSVQVPEDAQGRFEAKIESWKND